MAYLETVCIISIIRAKVCTHFSFFFVCAKIKKKNVSEELQNMELSGSYGGAAEETSVLGCDTI